MTGNAVPENASPTLYIETLGCQMNILDSELVVASLRAQGYRLVDSPDQADLILYNTCSVRQHAEDKIYSRLGTLRNAKEERPGRVIGVLGCMAQKDQQQIFDRAPHVDLVVGPGQLHQVPQLVQLARQGAGPRMEVSLDRTGGKRDDIARSFESYDPLRDPEMRPSPFQAYVRIMIGCDKFCTYCIVPSVRGPEQSRDPDIIVEEVRKLVDDGCREVTLLGQTVNSYKYRQGERTVRMADLLERLHAIPGLDRIKFVTNYPKDMTRELLEAVRDLKKCSRYLHVPAQSGCDDVLKRMKRGYTVADYRAMMERINDILPEAAVSSDFIVGFCGESDESFQKSIDLIRECRFKNSFIFKYSPRAGTKSHELFADDIPEEVKRERNQEMLAVQNQISLELNEPFVGQTVEILVEGLSKSAEKHGADGPIVQLTGRTMCDRIVVYEGTRRQIGQILPITIHTANAFTLHGRVATQHVGPEVFSLAL